MADYEVTKKAIATFLDKVNDVENMQGSIATAQQAVSDAEAGVGKAQDNLKAVLANVNTASLAAQVALDALIVDALADGLKINLPTIAPPPGA